MIVTLCGRKGFCWCCVEIASNENSLKKIPSIDLLRVANSSKMMSLLMVNFCIFASQSYKLLCQSSDR
jgi:hypothetical protein